jgi:hypothetical protein
MKQPYKFWKREELYHHCMKQALEFGFDVLEIKEIVFDKRWIPQEDFNGCNLVQDIYHPFYPCLKHDFDWIVGEGGLKADQTFYNNLKKSGMLTIKAKIWFFGVRLGWLLWYKWKKKKF